MLIRPSHMILKLIFTVGVVVMLDARATQADVIPFQLSTLNTKWYESPLPEGQTNLSALYRAPEINNGVQATLSVRLDEPSIGNENTESTDLTRAPASLNLDRYGQRWLSDFPRFGFKVLKTETRLMNGDPAIVADLQDTTTDRRQRQMLRTNGRQVAILTCTDSKAMFAQSSKNCELLMSTFRWVNSAPSAAGLRHAPATE